MTSNQQMDVDIALELATHAYKDPEIQQHKSAHLIANDKNTNVRLYEQNGTYFITHRGTKSLSDVGTDVSLLQGKLLDTDVYKNRLKTTKQFAELVPEHAKLYLTGHSLGATTAAFTLNDPILNQRVTSVIAANPGTSPLFDANKAFTGNQDKIMKISRSGDPISRFSFPGRRIEHSPSINLSGFSRGYSSSFPSFGKTNLLKGFLFSQHSFP